MTLPSRALALPVLAVALAAVPAEAGPRDFAIYVTRLGGDPEAAQPYIEKFLAYLEQAIGWPRGSASGKFLTTRKEALAYIDSAAPGLGLLEPSLYLELRRSHGLEPLVQVVSKDLVSERLHLVVKDPSIRTLSDLKGKRLWTTLADAPVYLSRIVLDGRVDAASHFELKAIGQAMKGVRGVLRGEADATLLDEEQLRAAQKLDGGAQLRSVYDSQPLPPMPVVAFGKSLKEEERRRLARALLEMCGTPKGAEVCREMHITRFAPVQGQAFLAAQKRYEQK
ncbi:MAG: PhnD/SsuA/transferrin family substrate-binding protein [Myxococcales bacterium]|nr:phosphate/phosphite/phosphonate ABC transporter substrate-binding protein [Myxococcota bacterium]MDW8282058.1 PhnD/SsuA/transferrin family substrate-binding protein [Myxococcales bacterium]